MYISRRIPRKLIPVSSQAYFKVQGKEDRESQAKHQIHYSIENFTANNFCLRLLHPKCVFCEILTKNWVSGGKNPPYKKGRGGGISTLFLRPFLRTSNHKILGRLFCFFFHRFSPICLDYMIESLIGTFSVKHLNFQYHIKIMKSKMDENF